jgi:hypothetical protein
VNESQTVEDKPSSFLNNGIAIAVAISAVFVTIYNIKDNNVVQAMSQAQAHTIDAWSFYQAKSTKEHLAENVKDQLGLQLLIQDKMNPMTKNKINVLVEKAEHDIEKYEKEKTELKAQAENYQAQYDELNIHDDQFDMAEAMISLAMAVLGISALTQLYPLFFFGLGTSLVGIFFGLAGFLGWNIHPQWLASILG